MCTQVHWPSLLSGHRFFSLSQILLAGALSRQKVGIGFLSEAVGFLEAIFHPGR